MPGDSLNNAAPAAGNSFSSKSRTEKQFARPRDEQAIEQARAADIVSLVESYGIAVETRGKEWFALCPFHSEESPSFTVRPAIGRYHCFGCGADGDTIQFVRDIEGVGFRDAVRKLSGSLPADAKPRTKREIEREDPEEWVPIIPAPADVTSPTRDTISRKIAGKSTRLTSSTRWEYRDGDGALIGYVHRFNRPDGGKEVMPQTYCQNSETGELAWRWLSFPKPRPIYGLDKLATNPNAQVIVVEGEKACDAAQALFTGADIPMSKLVVVSWPGGGKAVKHVDWSPLHGRKVGLCPDADQKTYVESHPKAGELMPFVEQPGTVAMLDIFDGIKDTCGAVRFFLPPAGVPDGWDLADDLPADFDLLKHVGAESSYAMNAADVRAKFSPTDPAVSVLIDDAARASAFVDDLTDPEKTAKARAEVAREVDPLASPLTADEQNEEQLEQDGDEFPKMIFAQSTPIIPAAAMLPSSGSDQVPAKTAIEIGQEIDASSDFVILGHNKDDIYIYSMERRTVLTTSSSKLNKISGLMDLASVSWWETYFNKASRSGPNVDVANAANWVLRVAGERGHYDTTRVRGRGVWIDAGRNVFHHGNHLSVDGKVVQLGKIQSRFVYESGIALPEPAKRGLTDEEGAALVEMMGRFSWAKPGSGVLLAGWNFLAPICGALKWRPHLWLTGGAGTGKSTLMEEVINHVTMPEWMLYLHGSTTEAGVRQNLQSDARPVMLDEFECNSPKDIPRIESILTLIRQSSSESGAKIGRGTVSGQAMSFSARSMFCLASVGVSLSRQTDEDRITRLDLTGNMAAPKWTELRREIDAIQESGDYALRMFTRALSMISVILEACETFKDVAGVELGRQRDGDQFGTLLAGAWCLQNGRAPSRDEAAAFTATHDWKEFCASASGKGDDSHQALDAVLAAPLVGEFGKWMSVGELLASVRAAGNKDDEAHQVLKRHGIRISPKGESVLFATGMKALTDLVQGTSFESDLAGRLARIGRKSIRDERQKFTGTRPLPFVAVPMATVFGDDLPQLL
ncbi:hypothetical protein KNO81_12355 [Paraburkholderia sediminicola]|nr:hypothetical protein [Paraburkholderia sediminicola]